MKKSLDVIYFEFTTPLHISNARADYGVSERTIHSDTLYAAIMQSWALLGKEEWITKEVSFTLSSLFPYTIDKTTKQKIHFFAKPFFQAPRNSSKEIATEDAKKFKKIKYVDIFHFEKYINKQAIDTGVDAIKGNYQVAKNININPNFISSEVQPRIIRPRNESEDTKPFYAEKLFFEKGSGMYCLCNFENEQTRNQVKAALTLLADNGLGTDRSIGNGCFNLSFGKITLDIPTNSQFVMNLSLFCPENKEALALLLNDEKVRYEIVKRGGWISEPHNTYRKRSIYMFQEGSVFNRTSTTIFSMGKTVNLKPSNELLPTKIDNPIWRVGKSLFIPVLI